MSKYSTFKLNTKADIKDLLEKLETDWMWNNYIKITGKWVIYLELHTGGHSHHETIIGALRRNTFFWCMFWQKSVRGGHHYFKIDTRLWNKPLFSNANEEGRDEQIQD